MLNSVYLCLLLFLLLVLVEYIPILLVFLKNSHWFLCVFLCFYFIDLLLSLLLLSYYLVFIHLWKKNFLLLSLSLHYCLIFLFS